MGTNWLAGPLGYKLLSYSTWVQISFGRGMPTEKVADLPQKAPLGAKLVIPARDTVQVLGNEGFGVEDFRVEGFRVEGFRAENFRVEG